jgi:hypothetical protein
MMRLIPKITPGQVHVNEEPDPYLAPAAPAELTGLAPDLAEILRRRRDRALERRDAERAMRKLKRDLPDLFFRRPS